jgi:hypothetical protein
MQSARLIYNLAKVRVLRIKLWFACVLRSLNLGLPIRYSAFPLLSEINWAKSIKLNPNDSCNPRLHSTLDVIVSLYRFEDFRKVLELSLGSCFDNPKIKFHFVLVSGSKSESSWLRNLTHNSHHKLYEFQERIGIYTAWNTAIKNGNGKFITNLNADDLRIPHSLCNQAVSLQESGASGSYGNFVLVDRILSTVKQLENPVLTSSLGAFDLETLVIKSQNFMHCAPMWERSLHSKVGIFDDTLFSSGDTEFWLRAMSRGAQFVSYHPVTTVYFYNPDGLSTSISSKGRHEWATVRDSFLRSTA